MTEEEDREAHREEHVKDVETMKRAMVDLTGNNPDIMLNAAVQYISDASDLAGGAVPQEYRKAVASSLRLIADKWETRVVENPQQIEYSGKITCD